VDRTTQENIVNFIANAPTADVQAIPTGLVVAGPSIASHAPFFERLGRKIKTEADSTYVLLTSGESPNLKTLLKNLIKKATSRVSDDDDDDIVGTSSRNGPKLLDFDIGHLQEWQKRNRAKRVVVTIQDSEAFDANVLVELIDIL
jgi:origin recognition complex subunit 3